MSILQNTESWVSREFVVRGHSMVPTFSDGSRVTLSPGPYLWRNPKRSDIVGLYGPDNRDRFELKRIIALPGESVSWKGGDIWINGMKLEETYVFLLPPKTPQDKTHTLELGPGEYFVAGDNRAFSRDSRIYGPVWLSDILGTVIENRLASWTGRFPKHP